MPFKSKQKVKILLDNEEEERRRKTNLLEALNLPTKRPFKKMFMNEQEKKIHSMVQRLTQIGKSSEKERQMKKEEHQGKVKKRLEKEQEKRDQKKKELKKESFKKGGKKKNRF